LLTVKRLQLETILPRDAMLACVVYAAVVCPSVCPSVCKPALYQNG